MRRSLREAVLCALLALAALSARFDGARVDHALQDPDIATRAAAARWLGERPRRATRAVPQLTALLAEPRTAGMAAFALGELGSASVGAISGLASLAQHPDPLLRIRAAVALARIAPEDPEAKAAIAAMRQSAEPLVRKLAGSR